MTEVNREAHWPALTHDSIFASMIKMHGAKFDQAAPKLHVASEMIARMDCKRKVSTGYM